MKGPKFYKSVIAVLLVINLAIIAFIWFGKPPHPPKPGENKISDFIGVKGDSKSIIDNLETEHHKEKRKLIHLDIDLHKQLYKEIGTEGDSDSILGQIESNKNKIEEMTFDFFDEISKHCTKEQKIELRKFVNKHLDELRPGPPRPPRND